MDAISVWPYRRTQISYFVPGLSARRRAPLRSLLSRSIRPLWREKLAKTGGLSTATIAGQSEREELLELLLAKGILHRSETQPVLSRDGASARWMLDSLLVTL